MNVTFEDSEQHESENELSLVLSIQFKYSRFKK